MITIISHSDCMLHEMGPQHLECPARITSINNALANSTVTYHNLNAIAATQEHLLLAHSKEYIQFVYANVPKNKELIYLDLDTAINKHSINAALLAVGSVIQAVDVAMADTKQLIFCNIRPPGHHAEQSQAMGFCIFNNLAIGVMYALQQYQLNRIAIVDFDIHHGNGTQAILQNEDRILLCSSYQHPFYPNRFTTEGKNTIHIQLPAGTNSNQYRELVKTNWLDQLRTFKPEMLFFSAGFDAHKDEPLGNINLITEDYFWLTKEITKATYDYTNGRVISTLEGGYNLKVLGQAVLAHLNGF